MDPRHSGPVGGGCMKSDVGHRKYVLVNDMARVFEFRHQEVFTIKRTWCSVEQDKDVLKETRYLFD